jgi:hypothetical protein
MSAAIYRRTMSVPTSYIVCFLTVLVLSPPLCLADCYQTNPSAQMRCAAQEQARQAQQEATRRQQEAQREAQQEAMRRQQEAQREAQQEAMRRQQEAQRQAQQEAMRRQQEAQRQAQQEAMRRQQEAQRQVQQEGVHRQQEARNQQLQERTRHEPLSRPAQDYGQRSARQPARAANIAVAQNRPGVVQHVDRPAAVPSNSARHVGEAAAGNPTTRRKEVPTGENTFVSHARQEVSKGSSRVSAASPESSKGDLIERTSGKSQTARRATVVNSPGVTAGGNQGRDREISLDEKSLVLTRANDSGYRAVRTTADGAHVVVEERRLPGGAGIVTAYKESKSGATVSRLYTDGRVVTNGTYFRSRGVIGGPKFVKYDNGLHAAYLANGRPLYAEQFRDITRPSGETLRVVQRTTLVPVGRNGGSTAVVRFYTLNTVKSINYVVYQPLPYRAEFYLGLYRPFVGSLMVKMICPLCPPPTAEFEDAFLAYAEPMDLVADLAMSDATNDDIAPEVPAPANVLQDVGNPVGADFDLEANLPPPPPEMVAAEEAFKGSGDEQVADLRITATNLRQGIANSAELGLAATVTKAQFSEVSYSPAAPNSATSNAPPILIPDYARTQLRKEARLSVALQQNQRQLFLPDVISSEYAKVFVFQATTPIDVTESGGDDQCTLSGGDLIRFARIPAATDAVATVKVISSRVGHCRPDAIVELGASDLQDMMNAFTERLEREKMRVTACQAPGGACVRT